MNKTPPFDPVEVYGIKTKDKKEIYGIRTRSHIEMFGLMLIFGSLLGFATYLIIIGRFHL